MVTMVKLCTVTMGMGPNRLKTLKSLKSTELIIIFFLFFYLWFTWWIFIDEWIIVNKLNAKAYIELVYTYGLCIWKYYEFWENYKERNTNMKLGTYRKRERRWRQDQKVEQSPENQKSFWNRSEGGKRCERRYKGRSLDR